jgi:hypothetical protein
VLARPRPRAPVFQSPIAYWDWLFVPIGLELRVRHGVAVGAVGGLPDQPGTPEPLGAEGVTLRFVILGVEFFLGVAVADDGDDDLGDGDAVALAADPPDVDPGRVVTVDVADGELADRDGAVGIGQPRLSSLCYEPPPRHPRPRDATAMTGSNRY